MARPEDAAAGPGRAGPALAALGLVLAATLLLRGTLPPYDDALFFGRFARNFLTSGTFSWQPGGPPLHGNTSQLHQLVVTGLFALVPGWGLWATRLLTALALLAGAALLSRHLPDSEARLPLWLAWTSPVVLATVPSGMETGLTGALGAAFLALVASSRGRTGPVLLGLFVAVLYTARPDTALLALPTLALAPWPRRRRAVALVVAVAALLLLLGLLHLGYGRAFPLSVQAKALLAGGLDARFLERSAAAKLRHTALFLWIAAPLLALALADLRRTWRLLLPVAIFESWLLLGALDVMGLLARFHAPALPWLVLAAGQARPEALPRAARLGLLGMLVLSLPLGLGLGALPADTGWLIGRVPLGVYGASLLAAAALLLRGATGARAGVILGAGLLACPLAPGSPAGPAPDGVLVDRARTQARSWAGIDTLRRCLGPGATVAHSELGVPGMLFPEGRVLDLGGLMDTAPLRAGFDVEAWCAEHAPDAVFLPHPNYTRLRAALEESACLRAFTHLEAGRSSSPLYVRTELIAADPCLLGGD